MATLAQFSYFREVAEQGGFSGAARALRISQPTLSKAVRLLEEEFGVRLFERSQGRRVELSAAGQGVLDTCRRILDEVEELSVRLKAGGRALSGPVTLAASDNLCHYVLPSLLRPFFCEHPRARLRLTAGTSASIREELLARRSELGVFFTRLAEPSLELTELGFVPFLAVVAPSTLARGSGARLRASALAEISYVGSRQRDYAAPYPALRMLDELGLKPGEVVETNIQEVQKRLVLEGYGYSVIPAFMVQDELRRGELRALEGPRVGSSLYLARLRGRPRSPGGAALEACLRAELPDRISRLRSK